MNRRDFVREVMLWSAGIALFPPRFSIGSELLAPEGAAPLLAVAKGKDHAGLVARAVAALGGMGRFVHPGDKVVVKPNIGWDRTPEQAGNTHPLVVKAVVEQVLAAGAGRVQVFDRTCNEERRCYATSGVRAAVEAIGDPRVRMEFVDPRKFVPVEIARGKSLTKVTIYQDALAADCYINLPVAKHHSLSRLTLGLKNSMGVLGGDRGQMHHDLGQKLAELATVIRPKLTIIDATRILLRNGPQGGSLDDVRSAETIIASADPVAADAYATTLFELNPVDIASTVAAYQLGLGEMALERMKIIHA